MSTIRTSYEGSAAPNMLRRIVSIAVDRLATEPHRTVPGLRRRYYYRGSFVLLEHLTPRALAINVERLRRRGEHEHAEKLAAAWEARGAEQ